MSRTEFFNTYFTGQKELNVMAAMGPSERAQFLSRVLGYERLRAAQGLARDRRKLIVAETTGLRSGMPDPDTVARALADTEQRLQSAVRRAEEAERRRAEGAAALAGVEPRWLEMQRAREKLSELVAELRVAGNEESSAMRELERVEREVAELSAAREELERVQRELTPLEGMQADLKRFDRLCTEEGRRQTLTEGIRALREDLTRLGERLAKIEAAPRMEGEVAAELEEKRRSLDDATQQLDALRTVWVRDRQEAETKRDSLRKQYGEIKEQRDRLVELGETGPCPVCTRPLGGGFRTVLDQFDEQLDTIAVDGKFYNNRLEQLKETPEDIAMLEENRRTLTAETTALERKLAKIQAAVAERAQLVRDVSQKEERQRTLDRELAALPSGYDAARHDELRRGVERLAPLSARVQRLGAVVDRAPRLEQDRARLVERLAGVRTRITDLRERRDALRFSEPDWTALRAEYERLSAELRAAELSAVGARGDAEGARTSLAAAEAQRRRLAEMQEKLGVLQTDKRLHDELDRAYTDLRTDLNFQLRPELSELASAFLTELTDARYSEIELDDQYNITVLEEGIPKPVISGGEEDLSNLVLRLAISQMIAERAGQSFSLLILDEVFGSLDLSRRQNVVELLRRLHDRFEQVILITHIEDVREGLDHVISVRYDEETGTSVVEQERDVEPPAEAYDESLGDLAGRGAA